MSIFLYPLDRLLPALRFPVLVRLIPLRLILLALFPLSLPFPVLSALPRLPVPALLALTLRLPALASLAGPLPIPLHLAPFPLVPHLPLLALPQFLLTQLSI